MGPRVSVVIPTHTGGPYVREAVESVRTQTFEDWEIVIVCDGCDDPMDDLSGDERITVVRQRQSGVAIARNAGFHATSGSLITFLDHDDLMFPGKLEAQETVFASDPTIGLCHTQFEQVDPDRNFLVRGHGEDIQYEDVLQCRYQMLISTAMVSREAVEVAGLFDPKTKAEDIDFVLRVSRAYRLAFIPEVLLQYRRHSQNVSGDPWVQFVEVDYVFRGFRRYLTSIGELGSLPLIDRGRHTNRRINSEIAILRAREAVHRGHGSPGAVASNLAIALYLSPGAVADNARAFFMARRG